MNDFGGFWQSGAADSDARSCHSHGAGRSFGRFFAGTEQFGISVGHLPLSTGCPLLRHSVQRCRRSGTFFSPHSYPFLWYGNIAQIQTKLISFGRSEKIKKHMFFLFWCKRSRVRVMSIQNLLSARKFLLALRV